MLPFRRRFLPQASLRMATAVLLAASALLVAACGVAVPAPQSSFPLVQPVGAALTATVVGTTALRTVGQSTGTAVANGGSVSTVTASASVTPAPITGGPAEQVSALALGGGTQVRSVPSMEQGQTVRTLPDRQPVVILREVRGERWIVGDQTWAMATQDWTNLWYQVDGGYVYSAFIFIPRPDEMAAIADHSAEHWVDVDLNAQTATAMIGESVAHKAEATTGKPGYETPTGTHTINYRKLNETMTSTQAAINDPNEQYDVKNVLYTQYFDTLGDALHLNYWQPVGVFGAARTSHGCVGLELHDAQFFWLFADSGSRVSIHPVVASSATATSTATATATATPAVTSTATVSVTATSSSHAPTPLTTVTPATTPDPNLRTAATSTPTLVIPPPPPPPTFPLVPRPSSPP